MRQTFIKPLVMFIKQLFLMNILLTTVVIRDMNILHFCFPICRLFVKPARITLQVPGSSLMPHTTTESVWAYIYIWYFTLFYWVYCLILFLLCFIQLSTVYIASQILHIFESLCNIYCMNVTVWHNTVPSLWVPRRDDHEGGSAHS